MRGLDDIARELVEAERDEREAAARARDLRVEFNRECQAIGVAPPPVFIPTYPAYPNPHWFVQYPTPLYIQGSSTKANVGRAIAGALNTYKAAGGQV